MINLAILLCALLAQSRDGQHDAWVDSILRSPTGRHFAHGPKAASTARPRPGSHSAGVQRPNPVRNSFGANDAMDVLVRRVNRQLVQLDALVLTGRLKESYTVVQTFEKQYPDGHVFVGPYLTSLALLLGKTDEAYATCVEELSASQRNLEDRSLELSLAAASRNQVVRGQLEYCLAQIRLSLPGEPNRPLPPSFRRLSNSPADVRFASLVALAFRGPVGLTLAFFGAAHNLRPLDTVVAGELTARYSSIGRYSAARHIAAEMTARLPEGPERNSFLRVLHDTNGKADVVRRVKVP